MSHALAIAGSSVDRAHRVRDRRGWKAGRWKARISSVVLPMTPHLATRGDCRDFRQILEPPPMFVHRKCFPGANPHAHYRRMCAYSLSFAMVTRYCLNIEKHQDCEK